MIPIHRTPLAAAVGERCRLLTTEISQCLPADRKRQSDLAWRRATTRRDVLHPVRHALTLMASGRECCMYCGESQGTDIDHFEPRTRNPLRTFDWLNHLLACSLCNSNYKRHRFPTDAGGEPLLIDPTVEDPFEHLRLNLATGEYRGLTERGRATIEVFRLNRPLLNRGRVQSRHVVAAFIARWCEGRDNGDDHRESDALQTIRDQPFADVCQSMLRYAILPRAEIIFSDVPELLGQLRRPDLRHALLVN